MKNKIYKAAISAFEELGFMFPLPESEDQERPSQPDAVVCVQFSGHFSGCLVIKAYNGLLAALASNMLGEFEAPSRQLQHDALKEMANVICGNVLPAVAGAKEVFYLDTPQILEDSSLNTAAPGPPAAEVEIALDQGSVNLILYITQEATALKEEAP